jgi:hypothetical protein
MKCGIVVSKFLKSTQASGSPVSFISPQQQSHQEYSYTISKDAIQYEIQRKRSKNQTRLIGIAIAAFVAISGYLIVDFLMHRAAAYRGMYKNHKMIYGLYFPETGPAWYHTESGLLEDLGLEDPADAFYRGESRSTPDVSIAVYTFGVKSVPERMSSGRKEELLAEAEEMLLNRMESARIACEIVDSQSYRLAGRDGFLIEAELERDGRRFRALVANAYYNSIAYVLYFVGPEEKMLELDEEVRRLIDSMSFKTSVI